MFNLIRKALNFIAPPARYAGHPDAIIIACYFNPQRSNYRLQAFNKWYESIKHVNHLIIECAIGGTRPQLPSYKNVIQVTADTLLWHKEALLNHLISILDPKYKYVFWVDTDVLFTNNNWIVDGVEQLQKQCIIQPFEYCVHLDKDEIKPSFDMSCLEGLLYPNGRNKTVWRSFCANYVTANHISADTNYDNHGHVGFAWGARTEVLKAVPLYDRALIGGADHIIAHAAAGHIPHNCITTVFKDDINAINEWSNAFYAVTQGKIGYVKGNLYHLWHGDLRKRRYHERIKEFTKINKGIIEKDKNGLYVANKQQDQHVRGYFKSREVIDDINLSDDGFFASVIYGYTFNDGMLGGMAGGNMLGGMIGDALNQSDNQPDQSIYDLESNDQPEQTFSTGENIKSELTPESNDQPEQPFSTGETTEQGTFSTGDSFGGESGNFS